MTDVDAGRRVTLPLDGRPIRQGSDWADLLTTLDALLTAAQNGGTAAVDVRLSALDPTFQRVSRVVSLVGTGRVSVEDNAPHLAALDLAGAKRVSELEAVNLAEASVRNSLLRAANNPALGGIGTAGHNRLLNDLSRHPRAYR